MRKLVVSILFVGGMVVISFYGLKYFAHQKDTSQSTAKKDTSFFATLPVADRSDKRFPTPCIPVRIGDRIVNSILDLGFVGEFSLSKDILDQIEEKKFLRLKTSYGFRGKQYEKKVYKIPSLGIGKMNFYNPYTQEEDEEFCKNSTILEDSSPYIKEHGRIGWQLFVGSGLFLDLGKNKVAICDSLSTLADKGYSISSFIQIPLSSERGLLEIQAQTDTGSLNCVLDTGATFSLLNVAPKNGSPVYEFNEFSETSKFELGEQNFGPVSFFHIPIELPIHVEAILGMDFFKSNVIFLDFTNNMAYIAPSQKAYTNEKE